MANQWEERFQPMIGTQNEFNHFDAHIFDTRKREPILISTCCRDHNEALNQSIVIAKVWNEKYAVDLIAERTVEKAKSIKIRQLFYLKRYF
jgi:histidinol phosphatase-like enzyme